MNAIQLTLFETITQTEERHYREKSNDHELRLGKTERSLDRVRKGTYAEIGSLKKRVLDLESRLEVLERGLCGGMLVQVKN